MFTWSASALTAYFAAVTASADETSATTYAVERSAEIVEAEVSAVLIGDTLHGSWGFGPSIPLAGLLAVRDGATGLTVPGLGRLEAVPSALGSGTAGTLIVARCDEPFTAEERQVLIGMAQALGLTLRGKRALADERRLRADQERERHLVERLLAIQREISARRPLPTILDAVTSGAAALLDGAAVALVLAEDDTITVASRSCDDDGLDLMLDAARHAMASAATHTCDSIIAAPVQVTGEMAGSLVARLPADPGEYRDRLAVFAQQVSLALTDARTVEAVHEAHHDPVTGLPSRALFLKIFHEAMDAGTTTSVLFIDLDRFKAVNDSLGHEAGDQLLAAAADRIRACLRPGDTAARLGGDEFAVLLADSAAADVATAVAEEIIAAAREPFRIAGRSVFIGASVGAALSTSAGEHPDVLLHNADLAMYRAKKAGPGKVVVYQDFMHTEALHYLNLRGDLQRALREDEFRLQYQPLVDLASGTTVGVETLIRWDSPTRGTVPPAEFIPIAEESGLITEIGQWVLETGARQVAAWRRTFPDLTLNVNLSGHQLLHPRLAEDVARALATAGLPSSAVTLELTESVLMKDPVRGVASLNRLRALGVQLSIDDFGTGYSSLSYLRELPVDELKIDRSFVARTERSAKDVALVRTIVELGRILGLRVVAEGIENPGQLDTLRDLGCQLGQGYHLCRPVDAGAIPAVLTHARSAAA